MKILLATPEFPPASSGVGYICQQEAEELRGLGHIVSIASRDSGDIILHSSGPRFPGILGLLQFWEVVHHWLQKYGSTYDAVWLHGPVLHEDFNLNIPGRVVITYHSTYRGFLEAFTKCGIWNLMPYYDLATRIEGRFIKNLRVDDATVIAISPHVKEELEQSGLHHNSLVIPNPLPAGARFDQTGTFLAPVRRRRFLYVGRFTEVKRPTVLLKLFQSIHRSRPNTSLSLLGAGNLARKVARRSSKMDGVFYHGPVSRDHALATYKQADIFISASCYEGLPSSVLEAAAFGLPLILSRIPAHEWLLQQGVGDGLLVDPNNPETCVSQIINYLDNPRIISRSLPKDFRLESVVRKYETIFEGGH